jgi:hypothetical protein
MLVFLLSSSILHASPTVFVLGSLGPILILTFMTWYLIVLIAHRNEIITAIAALLGLHRKGPTKVNFLAGIVTYVIIIGLVSWLLASDLAKPLIGELQGIVESIREGNPFQRSAPMNFASNPLPTTALFYYGTTVFVMICLVSLFFFFRGLHMALHYGNQISHETDREDELKKKAADVIQHAVLGLKTTKEYREIILQCYKQMCSIFADSGIAINQNETAREFATSISSKLHMGTEAVRGLTFLFEEARYSDHHMTDEQRISALSNLESLRQALSINAGVTV